ncbi:MAG TPA: LbtU family siderophore porin [Desulfobacteraceae bacterium]|nr:LbtU family siderophore porin [Desulfobacteraceae bacterium]
MKIIRKALVIFVTIFSLSMLTETQPAFSQGMSNYELEQEIKALKEKIEGRGILEKISDKLTFSGAIELDYSYKDNKDIAVNDSTSDLDIGTVELGLEVAFHEYVTGNFILKGENLDSDDDRVFWDEATITIQKEGFPLYFVGGKRGQPFGAFESHLINDPITQDCYEIVKTGATVGFATDYLDISATLYKGEELMTHLVDAGYGFERDNSPGYEETDDVSSYILNITIFPIEALMLSAYYDSEPGDGDRNETAGGTLHFEFQKITFDAEYIAAIQREKHFKDNREYNESAWFAAIAFQVMDPFEIAARYEAFDDDIDGDQDGHLDYRYSLGFTYTLFEKDDFATSIMGEYRVSNFEVEPGNPNGVDDKLNELFLRLAIEF